MIVVLHAGVFMRIDAATELADRLDRDGWDWAVDPEHGPNDRLSVVWVKRLGAPSVAALVYRGAESDSVEFFPTMELAYKALQSQKNDITDCP